ncbi:hypothetical protein DIPPA_00307 [Diplonema papillatum]|nr:hypothetical protein DIPPA_00307 [Diplonema papillatum]
MGSRGLFLLLFAPSVVAQCPQCLANCGLEFHGSGGENMSQYLPYHAGFPFKLWEDCDALREIDAQYPDLWLRPVVNEEFGVKGGDEKAFSIYSDMLEGADPMLGILNIDIQWVLGLADNLEPFPDALARDLLEKWRQVNARGETVAAPHRANQIVLYYRQDLFDQHNVALNFSTWESFEAGVAELQSSVQAARGDAAYRAFSYTLAGGSSDMSVALTTLLSGHDGGMIVETNGTVSVNNQNAIKTLAMMRRWAGTILHPATLLTGNNPISQLENDEAAVILQWTSLSDTIGAFEDQYNMSIAMGPIPGKTGAGCSGSWNIALSKHVKMKDLAFKIMESRLNTDYVIWEPDQEPYTPRFYENATLWGMWCAKNTLLCTAVETYPDFFSRLTHRPSAGCGPLFAKCQGVIKSVMDKFLADKLSPQETVAAMEIELKVLLGIWQQDALYDEPTAWTGMRIAAVVVGGCGVAYLLALSAIFCLKVNSLRKPKGFSIPLSLFLALMASLLFSVVQVITIKSWYDSFRDTSSDLGADVRQRSLQMVTETTQQSIETSFGQLTDAAVSIMKRFVEADFVRKLPYLDLDPRSLVLLFDQVNERIAVTSDRNKQPDGPVSDRLTPWGLAGLQLLGGNIKGKLNGTAFEHTIDGTPCFLDADTVQYKESIPGPNSAFLREISYMIVYIVPKDVVIGEADDALAHSVYVSILLLAVGLALLTTATSIITLPLVSLANDIENVRVMRLEASLGIKKSSSLTEIASLLVGFQHMCRMINEYKTFMPKTLFRESDHDGEESGSDALPKKPPVKAASHTSEGSASFRSMAAMSFELSGLQTMRGAILSISVHQPESGTAQSSFNLDTFTTVFTTVEKLAHSSSGIVHSFSTMHAEEILVSWGMTAGCPFARQRAVNVAFELKTLAADLKTRLSLAVCAGRFKAGNIGTLRTRGFCIAGNPVKSYDVVVKSSMALSFCLRRSIIVCDAEVADLPGFVMFEVDAANVDGRLTFLKEVVSRAAEDVQEWMYELDELKKNQPVLSRFLTAGDNITLLGLTNALKDPDCTRDDKLILENMKTIIEPFPHAAKCCITLAYDSVVMLKKYVSLSAPTAEDTGNEESKPSLKVS